MSVIYEGMFDVGWSVCSLWPTFIAIVWGVISWKARGESHSVDAAEQAFTSHFSRLRICILALFAAAFTAERLCCSSHDAVYRCLVSLSWRHPFITLFKCPYGVFLCAKTYHKWIKQHGWAFPPRKCHWFRQPDRVSDVQIKCWQDIEESYSKRYSRQFVF